MRLRGHVICIPMNEQACPSTAWLSTRTEQNKSGRSDESTTPKPGEKGSDYKGASDAHATCRRPHRLYQYTSPRYDVYRIATVGHLLRHPNVQPKPKWKAERQFSVRPSRPRECRAAHIMSTDDLLCVQYPRASIPQRPRRAALTSNYIPLRCVPEIG